MNHPSRCERQLLGHAGALRLLIALPLSSDKTIAVIDGSGVLADPAGINREELIRLAKLQVPIEHFSKLKLSKDGYLVRIKDQGVKLPSSEAVLDGTDFHNAAYLHFKGDLFVPCGGRPEVVNISNMAALVDSEGKPHFKYIVEGANWRDKLFARSPHRPRAVDRRIRRPDAARPPSSPFSTLKTNHALKTCTSSEAPSDSLLGRCQDVALLDLAVP
ncbi:hypothetical protein BC827DRAFT_1279316 [Russula dissimulans]|nr:hypothetical protein BC827DRAFT_1279316 [Russula dissimulans]